nr:dephospho-CoA kinase [uncultured Gellertiella sp.]
MIILGLTGSIGMGKSTTTQMFREAGIPVNDADQVVHQLYAGEAVGPVGEAFPGAVQDGVVDRRELSRQLALNPAQFKLLEKIVHPLVRRKETEFVEEQRRAGAGLVVLDIPLLFETGGADRADRIVVVSCDAEQQRERVLARPGMTPEKFALILSRQMPDTDKRAKADFVIDTGKGLDFARQQVAAIIAEVKRGKA